MIPELPSLPEGWEDLTSREQYDLIEKKLDEIQEKTSMNLAQEFHKEVQSSLREKDEDIEEWARDCLLPKLVGSSGGLVNIFEDTFQSYRFNYSEVESYLKREGFAVEMDYGDAPGQPNVLKISIPPQQNSL